MVRVAQPSGGETTFEKDLPRSPRTVRISQPCGGKTTFDKELPRSPRTIRVSQPSGGKTTFEEEPYPETRLRVLKPPGGGSSIAFGGDDEPARPTKSANPSATAPQDNSQSNGTVQNGNHTNGQTPTTNGTCNGTTSNGSMTPNGSTPTTASSPSSAKSQDTQNRLFGGSNNSTNGKDTPSKPKVRDHMRSSIFGDDGNTSSRNGTPNGTAYYGTWRRRDPVTGEGVQCWDLHAPRHGSCRGRRGNIRRGTPSACETSAKATPEPPKPSSAPAAQPAQAKTRVPPGGFSTALW